MCMCKTDRVYVGGGVGEELFQYFIFLPRLGEGWMSGVGRGKNYRGISKVDRASPYILTNYLIQRETKSEPKKFPV